MVEERELWERIRRGDATAFNTFYVENVSPLRRFLQQLVGTAQTAEDLSHETFLHFWRRLNEYRPDKGPPRAYLFGIARKRASEWWRRRKPEDLDMPLSIIAEDASTASRGSSNPVEGRSLVVDAFSQLDLDQRTLLWLREVEGQSYAELAQILEIPVGTVKSRLYAAREELRRIWHSAPRDGKEAAKTGEMEQNAKKGGVVR